jgi:predicted dehydrogenase
MQSRRSFIKSTSAFALLSNLGCYAYRSGLNYSSYKVGLIGAGWYGKMDVFRMMQISPVEVVAICDVDTRMLNDAIEQMRKRQKSGRKPKAYTDYRRMLEKEKLDIVLIGSPDHWHALQAIEAIESGAHIYLQKPISVDVLEGEAILTKARAYDRVVQVGTQRRSTPHLIEAKQKIIDSGLLGKVSHAEICCYYHMRRNIGNEIKAVPDYLDFDMWCGPAPRRAYVGLPHRGWWRAFMEYGNGIMGDMCIHMLDTVRWMLDLGWPKQVNSNGGIYIQKESASNISDTQTAVFEFDELNCVWQHRTWGTPPDPDYPWAFFIYGEKGTLKGSVHKYEFISAEGGESIKGQALFEKEQYPEDLTEKDIELHVASATRNHMQNFLEAIESNGRPIADIEQGLISSASCILGNMSMQLGRPLQYDHTKKICIGDEEATQLLARPYRKGWEHPF